jgi:SNF2 family DNA or RNA helicase
VMELVAEREQCVIAFNWQHELANLKQYADKYGFSYGEIHGGIPARERAGIVSRFQDGDLRILICHPQSAAHGLTLTAGTTTIWCSPTYNAEHYSQFNSRIYRAGQKRRTETIRIAYRDTAEMEVYERLDNKVTRMEDLLELFATFSDNHNQRKKTA